MKKHSEQELWAFVSRADTHEKIEIAIEYLTRLPYISIELYDDLMKGLAYNSRELYREERERSRQDYSPSCPWNAPGMSVSDFYR